MISRYKQETRKARAVSRLFADGENTGVIVCTLRDVQRGMDAVRAAKRAKEHSKRD